MDIRVLLKVKALSKSFNSSFIAWHNLIRKFQLSQISRIQLSIQCMGFLDSSSSTQNNFMVQESKAQHDSLHFSLNIMYFLLLIGLRIAMQKHYLWVVSYTFLTTITIYSITFVLQSLKELTLRFIKTESNGDQYPLVLWYRYCPLVYFPTQFDLLPVKWVNMMILCTKYILITYQFKITLSIR